MLQPLPEPLPTHLQPHEEADMGWRKHGTNHATHSYSVLQPSDGSQNWRHKLPCQPDSPSDTYDATASVVMICTSVE